MIAEVPVVHVVLTHARRHLAGRDDQHAVRSQDPPQLGQRLARAGQVREDVDQADDGEPAVLESEQLDRPVVDGQTRLGLRHGTAVCGELDAFALEAGLGRERQQQTAAAADVQPPPAVDLALREPDVGAELLGERAFGRQLLACGQHLPRPHVVPALELGHAPLGLWDVGDVEQVALAALS